MPDLPRVAGLWIGGSLSWLEQLCLTSFVQIGHPTALYTYGQVDGVPEGVEICDGNDIMPDPEVYTHERSGSVALFSDVFRYHLIKNAPGTIWIDTDIYAVRPIEPETPYVFGYETDRQMNGAVLGMPHDSEMLGMLLDLTSDPYNIPEFHNPRARERHRLAKEAGTPVHASEMPWGVWGPHAVTWAAKKSGNADKAQAREVYYPVHFAERNLFFKRPRLVMNMIKPETLTVHIWGRIKRVSGKRHDGGVPANCWLDRLCQQHGIDPMAAPITSHGKFDFTEDTPEETAEG
ncbi:hypothetical protein [Pontivivens insulae]|uniref:Alpha 1,4-glycosyltransferase domain-containing protein n=1 Tax=Pontivivens insulae TaxID=1639689 RepID=A0A2R8A8G0_9RHOB|nr:hypothetical protein [Pontivivens insulae]RED18422.1 hypothetical protein DFR53_0617 [Pontivivens insulae]SPF28320.1 hypothetical protein POI8812_00618 [Pontivivens insulae]